MSLEKRSDGGEEFTSPSEKEAPDQKKFGKQKSVFLYIMILFTVAFGLILMSFFMHQRSNEQVLGELHNNVNALEQLQDALDENLKLEKELTQVQEQVKDLEGQLDTSNTEVAQWKQESDQVGNALLAMNNLYVLQQEYAAKEYSSCKEAIDRMEQGGMVKNLPDYPIWEGVAATPLDRYHELKEAVAGKLVD